MTDLRSEHTGGVAPDEEPDDDFERRPGRGPHVRTPRATLDQWLPRHRWRAAVIVCAIAAAVIAGGTVAAVTLRGTSAPQAIPNADLPEGRAGAAMAYDSVSGLTVLYGGYTARGLNLYDTWTWDGSAWRPMSTPGQLAPRLFSPAMSDDPADGGVLLVGATVPGQDVLCAPAAVLTCSAATTPSRSAEVTETWLLTGSTWQQTATGSTQPTTPLNLATVPNTSQVVAVADTTDRNCSAAHCPLTPNVCVAQPLSDTCLNTVRVSTWYWSAKHWTASSEVLDLDGGVLVVPSAAGATIEVVSLFAPVPPSCLNTDGGCPVVPSVPRSWHWAAGTWVADPATANLPPLQSGAIAFNGSNAVLLSFGDRAWQLTDGTWSQLSGTAPIGDRADASFAVDRNGRYILFGGSSVLGGAGNDTWLLTPSGWQHVSGDPPTPQASPVRTTADHQRCAGHTTIPEYLC